MEGMTKTAGVDNSTATPVRVTIVCPIRNHAHYGQPARVNDVGPLPQDRICKLIDRAYGRPPVLSVVHASDCGVYLGHFSRAGWDRCTCSAA